jgi:hypothetical protein
MISILAETFCRSPSLRSRSCRSVPTPSVGLQAFLHRAATGPADGAAHPLRYQVIAVLS